MALWGQMTSVVGIIIAILSPFLGAIADYQQRRKSLLFFFTVVNIVATAGLWVALPGQQYVMIALLLAGIATIGFEIATVFYNSLLPSLVAPSHIGRLSGWGWALGYAGGLCSLVICLLLFIQPETPWGDWIKLVLNMCGPPIWYVPYGFYYFQGLYFFLSKKNAKDRPNRYGRLQR
ncbi:MAG: MFS transporter [Rhodospirillaceae bacterium]|nr:MFS transporter [Rhodospirillaceae bacterium]